MASTVNITFLGGLNAIGRNCAAIESEGQLLLVDCGIMFPDSQMVGVDLVLPDFTWLRETDLEIVGCIVTHGHEDHHGALSYLLRETSFPIYGSALTLEFSRNRIAEAGLLDHTELRVVEDGAVIDIGRFRCEFIPITHSVPYATALVVHTPQGVILHTGDFKLDPTPIDGRLSDLDRIRTLAAEPGIRLMLSDSTNAEREGWSPSEASVRPGIETAFEAARGKRVVASCTSSHVHRVQQLIDTAAADNRVVATVGLSMKKNLRIARELDLITIDESQVREISDTVSMRPEDVCVIATGSQGEPMSTLARAAVSESKQFEFSPTDLVLLSSRAIPGNESSVNRLINDLVSRGVKVVHGGVSHVHVSGHAYRDELAEMIDAASPEWFIPVHGEPRHLAAHLDIAYASGIPNERALLCHDGDRVVLTDDGCVVEHDAIPAEHTFVDGLLSDVSHGLLRDRRIIGTEGVVAVFLVVDIEHRVLLVTPHVVSQGWITTNAAPDVIEAAETAATKAAYEALGSQSCDLDDVRRAVRRAVGSYVANSTRRRPMIVPVVLEF